MPFRGQKLKSSKKKGLKDKVSEIRKDKVSEAKTDQVSESKTEQASEGKTDQVSEKGNQLQASLTRDHQGHHHLLHLQLQRKRLITNKINLLKMFKKNYRSIDKRSNKLEKRKGLR